MDKTIAKEKIRKVLRDSVVRGYDWQLPREIKASIPDVGECALAARCREMARAGECERRKRNGGKEVEFRLSPNGAAA